MARVTFARSPAVIIAPFDPGAMMADELAKPELIVSAREAEGPGSSTQEVVRQVNHGRVRTEEERPLQAECRLVVQRPLPPAVRHVLRQYHGDRRGWVLFAHCVQVM